MQKKRKNVGNFKSYAKKSDFDPPFWIVPPLTTDLTKTALDAWF
jgi:hypothetical protein